MTATDPNTASADPAADLALVKRLRDAPIDTDGVIKLKWMREAAAAIERLLRERDAAEAKAGLAIVDCVMTKRQLDAALAKGREETAQIAERISVRSDASIYFGVPFAAMNESAKFAAHTTAQQIAAEIRALSPSSPGEPAGSGWQPTSADDIRAAGWSVAVHNDYRQDGKAHTFWLFVKDGQAVKGEGETDFAALEQVRAQIDLLPAPPHEPTGET